MESIRANIESVHLFLEDRGRVQNVRSIPARLVYDMLVLSNNGMKAQYIERDRLTPKQAINTKYLECAKLEEVPVSDCPCDADEGCTWFRIAEPLPQFQGTKPDHVYLSITGGLTEMVYHDIKRVGHVKDSFRPWEKKKDRYVIKRLVDGVYVYFQIAEGRDPEYVSVGANYADDLAVLRYVQKCQSKVVCGVLDRDFDIDQRYKQRVVQGAAFMVAEFMGINRVADNISDDVDGSSAPSEQNV